MNMKNQKHQKQQEMLLKETIVDTVRLADSQNDTLDSLQPTNINNYLQVDDNRTEPTITYPRFKRVNSPLSVNSNSTRSGRDQQKSQLISTRQQLLEQQNSQQVMQPPSSYALTSNQKKNPVLDSLQGAARQYLQQRRPQTCRNKQPTISYNIRLSSRSPNKNKQNTMNIVTQTKEKEKKEAAPRNQLALRRKQIRERKMAAMNGQQKHPLRDQRNNKQAGLRQQGQYQLPSLSKCLENQILPKNSELIKRMYSIATKCQPQSSRQFREMCQIQVCSDPEQFIATQRAQSSRVQNRRSICDDLEQFTETQKLATKSFNTKKDINDINREVSDQDQSASNMFQLYSPLKAMLPENNEVLGHFSEFQQLKAKVVKFPLEQQKPQVVSKISNQARKSNKFYGSKNIVSGKNGQRSSIGDTLYLKQEQPQVNSDFGPEDAENNQMLLVQGSSDMFSSQTQRGVRSSIQQSDFVNDGLIVYEEKQRQANGSQSNSCSSPGQRSHRKSSKKLMKLKQVALNGESRQVVKKHSSKNSRNSYNDAARATSRKENDENESPTINHTIEMKLMVNESGSGQKMVKKKRSQLELSLPPTSSQQNIKDQNSSHSTLPDNVYAESKPATKEQINGFYYKSRCQSCRLREEQLKIIYSQQREQRLKKQERLDSTLMKNSDQDDEIVSEQEHIVNAYHLSPNKDNYVWKKTVKYITKEGGNVERCCEMERILKSDDSPQRLAKGSINNSAKDLHAKQASQFSDTDAMVMTENFPTRDHSVAIVQEQETLEANPTPQFRVSLKSARAHKSKKKIRRVDRNKSPKLQSTDSCVTNAFPPNLTNVPAINHYRVASANNRNLSQQRSGIFGKKIKFDQRINLETVNIQRRRRRPRNKKKKNSSDLYVTNYHVIAQKSQLSADRPLNTTATLVDKNLVGLTQHELHQGPSSEHQNQKPIVLEEVEDNQSINTFVSDNPTNKRTVSDSKMHKSFERFSYKQHKSSADLEHFSGNRIQSRNNNFSDKKRSNYNYQKQSSKRSEDIKKKSSARSSTISNQSVNQNTLEQIINDKDGNNVNSNLEKANSQTCIKEMDERLEDEETITQQQKVHEKNNSSKGQGLRIKAVKDLPAKTEPTSAKGQQQKTQQARINVYNYSPKRVQSQNMNSLNDIKIIKSQIEVEEQKESQQKQENITEKVESSQNFNSNSVKTKQVNVNNGQLFFGQPIKDAIALVQGSTQTQETSQQMILTSRQSQRIRTNFQLLLQDQHQTSESLLQVPSFNQLKGGDISRKSLLIKPWQNQTQTSTLNIKRSSMQQKQYQSNPKSARSTLKEKESKFAELAGQMFNSTLRMDPTVVNKRLLQMSGDNDHEIHELLVRERLRLKKLEAMRTIKISQPMIGNSDEEDILIQSDINSIKSIHQQQAANKPAQKKRSQIYSRVSSVNQIRQSYDDADKVNQTSTSKQNEYLESMVVQKDNAIVDINLQNDADETDSNHCFNFINKKPKKGKKEQQTKKALKTGTSEDFTDEDYNDEILGVRHSNLADAHKSRQSNLENQQTNRSISKIEIKVNNNKYNQEAVVTSGEVMSMLNIQSKKNSALKLQSYRSQKTQITSSKNIGGKNLAFKQPIGQSTLRVLSKRNSSSLINSDKSVNSGNGTKIGDIIDEKTQERIRKEQEEAEYIQQVIQENKEAEEAERLLKLQREKFYRRVNHNSKKFNMNMIDR